MALNWNHNQVVCIIKWRHGPNRLESWRWGRSKSKAPWNQFHRPAHVHRYMWSNTCMSAMVAIQCQNLLLAQWHARSAIGSVKYIDRLLVPNRSRNFSKNNLQSLASFIVSDIVASSHYRCRRCRHHRPLTSAKYWYAFARAVSQRWFIANVFVGNSHIFR